MVPCFSLLGTLLSSDQAPALLEGSPEFLKSALHSQPQTSQKSLKHFPLPLNIVFKKVPLLFAVISLVFTATQGSAREGMRASQARGQHPHPPHTGCMILGKWLDRPEPQFPHLCNGDNASTSILERPKGLRENSQVEQVPGTQEGIFLIAQMVNNLPAMQETRVRFLGREDPLEKEMATQSSKFLPGKSHGQRRLEGYHPWGCKSQTQLSD